MALLVEIAEADLSGTPISPGSKKKTRRTSKTSSHTIAKVPRPAPEKNSVSTIASVDVLTPPIAALSAAWLPEDTFECMMNTTNSSYRFEEPLRAEATVDVRREEKSNSNPRTEVGNRRYARGRLKADESDESRDEGSKREGKPLPEHRLSLNLQVDPRLTYERRVLKYRLPDKDLLRLKDALRSKHGLVKERAPQKCLDIRQPPRVFPRPTLTSQSRMEVQRHRLIVRCSNILSMMEKYDQLSKLPAHEAESMFSRLRNEVMERTTDDIDLEMDRDFLGNLRDLAGREKHYRIKSKENKVSKFRFQHSRGMPVISSYFRENYEGYRRPPFLPFTRRLALKSRDLPNIDAKREIWLVPVGDDDDPSTRMIRKSKKEDPNDRRSKREKARPPLRRRRERVVRDDASMMRQTNDADGNGRGRRRPRPPWRLPSACVFPVWPGSVSQEERSRGYQG